MGVNGATIVSGVRVLDEDSVLRTAGQGATFQQVRGARLLTFTWERPPAAIPPDGEAGR